MKKETKIDESALDSGKGSTKKGKTILSAGKGEGVERGGAERGGAESGEVKRGRGQQLSQRRHVAHGPWGCLRVLGGLGRAHEEGKGG